MKITTRMMTQAAVIAATYVVLTLPFAQFAFGGPIQFRLSEALTVLAALTPAAVPGLFMGCLIANLFNPTTFGLLDIVLGSLATLVAAWLTWRLSNDWREKNQNFSYRTILILSPSVLINAIVIGLYLPFLLPDQVVSLSIVLAFMGSIFVSQSIVVYAIGLPLLLALRRIKLNTSLPV